MLSALRAGDEEQFRRLVLTLTPALLALARRYVDTPAAAEDVVQETWIAVLDGLDRFEQRSTLRTWVCGILVHKARRLGARDRRSLPFSAVRRDERAPAVDPGRFHSRADAARTGTWALPPVRWDLEPEEQLGAAELRTVIDAAIDALPPRQREAMTLRDVLGLDATETSQVLGVTESNQRVLLHRARSKVRAAVESYAGRGPAAPAAPAERRRR